MSQNYIRELRREVAKHKGRAGVPIEISNGFAEALLEQIDMERANAWDEGRLQGVHIATWSNGTSPHFQQPSWSNPYRDQP
jgi:hypothetical protein